MQKSPRTSGRRCVINNMALGRHLQWFMNQLVQNGLSTCRVYCISTDVFNVRAHGDSMPVRCCTMDVQKISKISMFKCAYQVIFDKATQTSYLRHIKCLKFEKNVGENNSFPWPTHHLRCALYNITTELFKYMEFNGVIAVVIGVRYNRTITKRSVT